MRNLNLIEEYFVKLHRNFGISELSYRNQKLELNEDTMKQMVFMSEAFNDEFENLISHCGLLYSEIKKSFSLKIRKDINDNYLVTLS